MEIRKRFIRSGHHEVRRQEFRSDQTDFLEDIGSRVLNIIGYPCTRNNTSRITATDFLCHDGRYIDFQFSQNFSRYGEIRIDMISAFIFHDHLFSDKETQRRLARSAIIAEYRRTRSMNAAIRSVGTVKKSGKFFHRCPDRPYKVFFFIYDQKFSMSRPVPDRMALVDVEKTTRFLQDRSAKGTLISPDGSNFHLNCKEKMSEIYGSAFICLDYNDMIASGVAEEIPLTDDVLAIFEDDGKMKDNTMAA